MASEITRLHRPLVEQVVIALQDVFGSGYQADKVIERLFKNNKKLGARDRKFIAETTYDVIRNWRLLWVALGASEPSLDHDPLMRLIGSWLLTKDGGSLPPWPEFFSLNRERMADGMKAARAGSVAIAQSVPDWLYEYGRKEIGPKWDEFLAKLNEQAPVCLRANRLKNTREELARTLAKEDIQTRPAPDTNDGLILVERKNVFTSQAFKAGLFEIQDGASQQVATIVDPKPTDRVIDACAGGGGKTLHLAALMKKQRQNYFDGHH